MVDVAQPLFATAPARERRIDLSVRLRSGAEYIVIPLIALAVSALLFALFLLALGKFILQLFGPGFDQGYPLLFVLAVGLLARAAVGPVERLLMMLGEQRICAAAYCAAFILNLSLCTLLIPRFGGMGAAMSTATALIVESILLFLATKRRLGLHVFIWRR